jgi:hypothetical protein
MLRIASARPTLPARGREAISVVAKHQAKLVPTKKRRKNRRFF